MSFALWFGLLLTALISLIRVLGTFPILPVGGLENTRLFRKITLSLLALAVGVALGFAARLGVPGPARLGLREGKIAGLAGTLMGDPRGLSGGQGMAFLNLETTAGKDGLRASARGTVLVFFPEETVPRLRTFGRLSRVYLEGAFLPPVAGRVGLVFQAKGTHILEAAPVVERFRTGARLAIAEKFSPHTWGGLALALLLGVRDSLETELSASYRDAGCAHVLALSGMHLAIVSAVIAFLLKKLLGIKAAAVLGGLFILLYAGLVGALPSLERAVLMYLLGTLAVLGAFPRRPAVLLALAFVIQICLRPASGDSLSFILSYLALAGILALGDPLHDLFRGIVPEVLSLPLSASIGAFLATAGVSAASFGVLRPVGIFAGLVITPFTGVFMIAAMMYLTAAFLPLPLLAPLLGRALSLLSAVLFRLAGWAGQVPGLRVSNIQTVLAASLAVSIALVLFWKHRSEKGRRLVPFAAD
ncbi:MAG: ComEC/Rec2 family competence protein [Treponema sp.]|jgi:competence protein ComEC|nr:ComEC/Rec2 family competence protein [Treponema sp.]